MPEYTGEQLQQMRDQGSTYPEIAEETGMHPEAVRSKVRCYKISRAQAAKIPREFQAVNLGTPLELEGDWMIVGDVHVPTTDYSLCQKMTAIAKKYLTNPRLIIAGDFFSQDSFSQYAPTVEPPTFAQELAAGTTLLHEWLATFSQIIALMGNHDRRIVKYTAAAINGADVYRMITHDPKLQVSNFGWCTVSTPGGVYRVTHARNYSINQLTVASDLANKYQSHVIAFHEHRLAKGFDRYGRFLVINGGGLFDASQLAYAVLDDSKSAGMTPGFVMLRNGTPVLFGREPFTDWGCWL